MENIQAATLTEEQQQRWNVLAEKLQLETLTTSEHQELLDLNEISELKNVERITALAKLAQLKKVPLCDLMDELATNPAKGDPNQALQSLD